MGRVREGRAGGVLASRRADRNRISEAQHGDDRLFTPVISPVPIPTVLTRRLQQFAFKVQNHASTRRCVDCNSNRVMRSSSYRRWHQNCRTTSQARSGDSRQPPLPILHGELLCASSRPPETRHSKRAHPPGRRHVNILDLDSDPRRGTDASLCVGLRPPPPRSKIHGDCGRGVAGGASKETLPTRVRPGRSSVPTYRADQLSYPAQLDALSAEGENRRVTQSRPPPKFRFHKHLPDL